MAAPKGYSRDSLITLLHQAAEKHRSPPRLEDVRSDPDLPSPTTYYQHFDSWNNALTAAGFTTNHGRSFNETGISGRDYYHYLRDISECANCGEGRNPCTQFHHVNPDDKEHNLGKIMSSSATKIYAEVQKCVCLCANCHFLQQSGNVTVTESDIPEWPSPKDVAERT